MSQPLSNGSMEPECHDLLQVSLNSHFTTSYIMSLSTFPPDDAGPRLIRQYLYDHLISKHDTSPNVAKEISDKWQIGRGIDFREIVAQKHTVPDRFLGVFGSGIGPFLRRSVQEDLMELWYASSTGILFKRMIFATAIIVPLLFIWESTRSFRKYPLLTAAAKAGGLFGLSMTICTLLSWNYTTRLAILCLILMVVGLSVSLFSMLTMNIYDSDEKRAQKKANQATEEKGKGA